MRLPKKRQILFAVILLVVGFAAGRACSPDVPAANADQDTASTPADAPSIWT